MTFRNALISVSNKNGLSSFVGNLLFPYSPRHTSLFNIYSTGGTYNELKNNFPDSKVIHSISDITKFPEILNGRVKTLHPKILGGILCDVENDDHINDMKSHEIQKCRSGSVWIKGFFFRAKIPIFCGKNDYSATW